MQLSLQLPLLPLLLLLLSLLPCLFVTAAITDAACRSAVVRDVTAASAIAAGAQVPLSTDGAGSSITAVEGGALPYRDKILQLDSVRS